ncbi:IS66 family transposase zinc-finger binding domain-containing protein [Methylobacterium nonmethylotrophicum]|uniref:IS66 family transposase zinc-finger binding domain-containing protein n=1 Tax=Methylobacterium nonmethylotrophicum TaxID=1141884 RepID=UPI001436C931|nr:IS66 family transposase zinc-finger binding domain-containing protein [Methylobacterium nonmethylotrophicum]
MERRPACPSAGGEPLPDALPADMVSPHERIDLPPVRPVAAQHRRFGVNCPACRTDVPADAAASPSGPIHIGASSGPVDVQSPRPSEASITKLSAGFAIRNRGTSKNKQT